MDVSDCSISTSVVEYDMSSFPSIKSTLGNPSEYCSWMFDGVSLSPTRGLLFRTSPPVVGVVECLAPAFNAERNEQTSLMTIRLIVYDIKKNNLLLSNMLHLNSPLRCLEMLSETGRVARMFIPDHMLPLFQMRIQNDVSLDVLNTIKDMSIGEGRDALVTAVEAQELVEDVLAESDRFLEMPVGSKFKAVCPNDYMVEMQISLVDDNEEPISRIYTITNVDLETGYITLNDELFVPEAYRTIRVRQGWVEGGNRIYCEHVLTEGKYVVCYMPNFRPFEKNINVSMYPKILRRVHDNVYEADRVFSRDECISAHMGTMLLMKNPDMVSGNVSIVPDPATSDRIDVTIDITSGVWTTFLSNSDIEYLLTNSRMASVVSRG